MNTASSANYGRRGADPFITALYLRPKTDFTRVVFPWDLETKTFQLNEFNPYTYASHISKPEIDQFFSKLSRCVNYIPYNPLCMILVGLLLMLIVMGVMVILVLSLKSTFLVSLVGLAFLVFIPFVVCSQYKRLRLLKEREAEF